MPFPQSTKDFEECERCGDIICFGGCEDIKKRIEGYINDIIEYSKEFSNAKLSLDFERAITIETKLIPHLKQQILNLI